MTMLGIADLRARWVYTAFGIRKLRHKEGFPATAYCINNGKTPVWRIEDIEAYENDHPEVRDMKKKLAKVRSYAIANFKKPAGSRR